MKSKKNIIRLGSNHLKVILLYNSKCLSVFEGTCSQLSFNNAIDKVKKIVYKVRLGLLNSEATI